MTIQKSILKNIKLIWLSNNTIIKYNCQIYFENLGIITYIPKNNYLS